MNLELFKDFQPEVFDKHILNTFEAMGNLNFDDKTHPIAVMHSKMKTKPVTTILALLTKNCLGNLNCVIIGVFRTTYLAAFAYAEEIYKAKIQTLEAELAAYKTHLT